MRQFTFTAFLFVIAISNASATIINFSSSPSGRSAVDASLTTLPDGRQYLVGTFATPGAISLSLGSVSNILTAGGWSQFDGAQTIGTAVSSGGKLLGTATDNSATAVPFNNKDLYFVIFNTTSSGTATQMGIFQATAAAVAVKFPPNAGGVGDSVTVSMNDTTIPAVGGVGSTSASPQRFILTTLVPEPSAVGLLASGILGLVGYRRLRSRA